MPARLEIICGPMFAGKSTELIRRLREARNAGLATCAFKPATDTRSGPAAISAHTGDSFDALPIDRAAHLVPLVTCPEVAVVGIDEAHFFGPELINPVRTLLRLGARLIIAGVERDHRGRPFEPFPALLCEADDILKITATCALCGRPAVHTQRMIASDAPIVVGGAESYQPRCRACFQAGT